MKPPILDEFTHLPLTRQRKWQLRKRRDHCCTQCGQPAVIACYCRPCADQHNKISNVARDRKPLTSTSISTNLPPCAH
jgi:hypothetical protein